MAVYDFLIAILTIFMTVFCNLAQATEEISTAMNMTKEECFEKYSKKDYRPRYSQIIPPLLLSFPGSGNTWARLLIEYSSGIYTGSIYTDHSLKSVFGGEKSCSFRTSVIKAHPADLNTTIAGRITHTLPSPKCDRGGVKYWDSAIILIRDPYRTIWSDFQRQHNPIQRNHVKGIFFFFIFLYFLSFFPTIISVFYFS